MASAMVEACLAPLMSHNGDVLMSHQGHVQTLDGMRWVIQVWHVATGAAGCAMRVPLRAYRCGNEPIAVEISVLLYK